MNKIIKSSPLEEEAQDFIVNQWNLLIRKTQLLSNKPKLCDLSIH
jgi:hypothetical protein